MFETLALWYTCCDRSGKAAVKVPIAHLEHAIRTAASEEGREHMQMPWETGDDHKKRTGKDVL